MTEAGGFLTVADARDLAAHPGTVGRPYPVVETPDRRPRRRRRRRGAGPLAHGDERLRRRRPDEAETVDADGWLHTGDLGHLTEDGYLFIDGRSKDVVIRGGENIACPHVEAAIATHPAVVEVAALGHPAPRPRRGTGGGGGAPADAAAADGRGAGRATSRACCPTSRSRRAGRSAPQPLPTLAGEKVDKKSLARVVRAPVTDAQLPIPPMGI